MHKHTILVTGGLGFIGHSVVKKLENLGHDVFVVDNRTTYGVVPQDQIDYLMKERCYGMKAGPINMDIVDSDMDIVFDETKPDIVIHLASFPRQKVVNSNPTLGAKTMMEGLLNLCELSTKYHVDRFVYISSSMVYGDFQDGVTEEAVCRPQGQYAIMKYAGEQLVKDYASSGKFEYTMVRPSAVYGPYDVADRVISKFMLAAMNNETLTVCGQAEKLDFTFVDDLADGIVLAALSSNPNRTYNMTRGQSYTLLEAAELIVSIVGKGTIDITDRNKSFPNRGTLDISRARNVLGFNPTTDLKQGLTVYHSYLAASTFWLRQ